MAQKSDLGWSFWLYVIFVVVGVIAAIVLGDDGTLLGRDPWHNR